MTKPATKQDVTVYQGVHQSITIQIVDKNDNNLDLSPWDDIIFKAYQAGEVLFTKSLSGSGGGVVFTNETDGLVRVEIEGSDLEVDIGSILYDLTGLRTVSGSERTDIFVADSKLHVVETSSVPNS
jgi:hypothetical protein